MKKVISFEFIVSLLTSIASLVISLFDKLNWILIMVSVECFALAMIILFINYYSLIKAKK
jgi:hypothetical protein